jgi:hypothetical protein
MQRRTLVGSHDLQIWLSNTLGPAIALSSSPVHQFNEGVEFMNALEIKNALCTSPSRKVLAPLLMNLARLGLPLYLVACGATGAQDPNSPANSDLDSPTRNPDSPFEARRMEGAGAPKLQLVNNTEITVYVACNGASERAIVVPSRERREVQIPAGFYSCTLSGGDARPYTWSENYETGVRYSFTAVLRSTAMYPGAF